MADRIVGMTTTLLLAILTDRAFQMGRRGKLPAFESAFLAPNINWTRAPDPDWLIEPLKEKANPKNYNDTVLASKEYFAVNTIENIRLQDSFLRQDLVPILGGDARTTLLVSNRGKTIRMFENQHYVQRLQDMKLNPYTAFGCLLNYLVQPKPQIFLPMYDQFVQMTEPNPAVLKISIQVRAGDSVWGSNTGPHNAAEGEAVLNGVSRFFSCAEQIEKFVLADNPGKYSSVLWYLATDSRALRHAAVARYGSKVVTNPHSHIEHSAKEQSVCAAGDAACAVSDLGFNTAAAEWWLLGYADYHVITLYSGFGRSGAFRTLTTDRIYTVHQKEVTCNKDSYSNLEALMYDWAGI
jgi:hypothetical protein